MSYRLLTALCCLGAGTIVSGCKARHDGQVKEAEDAPPEGDAAQPSDTTQIPDAPGESMDETESAGVPGEIGCVCEGQGAQYALNRYTAANGAPAKAQLAKGLTLAACVKAKFTPGNCGSAF